MDPAHVLHVPQIGEGGKIIMKKGMKVKEVKKLVRQQEPMVIKARKPAAKPLPQQPPADGELVEPEQQVIVNQPLQLAAEENQL